MPRWVHGAGYQWAQRDDGQSLCGPQCASNRLGLQQQSQPQGRAVWPAPYSLQKSGGDRHRIPEAAQRFYRAESESIYEGLKPVSDSRDAKLNTEGRHTQDTTSRIFQGTIQVLRAIRCWLEKSHSDVSQEGWMCTSLQSSRQEQWEQRLQ